MLERYMGDKQSYRWQIYRLNYLINRLLSKYLYSFSNNKITNFMKYDDPETLKGSTAYLEVKKNLKRNRDTEFFTQSKKLIEESGVSFSKILACLFRELKISFQKIKDWHEKEEICLESKLIFNVDNLKFNLGNSNIYLTEIQKLINKNKNYFYLTILNGSIGTNDYKPGWSDVDIFCMISEKVITSATRLKELRPIILKMNALIVKYNILQLHGIFISTELEKLFYLNSTFPRICLEYGLIIAKKDDVFEIQKACWEIEAYNYFLSDIYENSIKLLNKKELSLRNKTVLLHRIYSFPFAFLRCLGILLYKRESYDYLSNNFNHLFPKINEFYGEVNLFYRNWKIERYKTLILRDKIINFFNPLYINRILSRVLFFFEPEIVRNINRGYERYVKHNLDNYRNYLEIALSIVRNR